MTDMDDYYMKVGKYAPKPEPEEPSETSNFVGYIAGCLLAVVFWLWFFMWVTSKI